MRVLKRIFITIAPAAVIFVMTWGGYYAFRSSNSIYREDVQPGGVAYALWIPKAQNSMDFPWLIIDRTFFHKTVKTISGQGDQPRLFHIAPDGKSIIPVTK